MIHTLFMWCNDTSLGAFVRDSPWAFAVTEGIHLVGLAAIGGAVLVVDLRLLGFGLTRQPLAALARDANRLLAISLAIMVASGLALFASEANKAYENTAFWVKIVALILVVIFTYTARLKVANAGESRVSPLYCKVIALVSLTLWFIVAAGGRWIGFSG